MPELRFASNKSKIADGMRIMRVSNDGALFEILVDPKEARFSEVILATAPQPLVIPNLDDLIETVGTPTTDRLSYTRADAALLRDHIAFTEGMTDAEMSLYLWDVLKIHSSTLT